jgi:ppGpp synthetase/RelA/SpoT-type nucleotidyltranferase
MTAHLIADFDSRANTYDGFREYLELLLPKLLKSEGIHYHKIEARVKTRKSLEEKLSRSDKNYTTLDEVTDICGLRVITHFDSEVDHIATVVEREFKIDRRNSVDKRIYKDPNRFGYVSLHYVISFKTPRSKLAECKPWAGYKAEVQIRTILQHAWAEIEHDLGFKSPVAVPREVKRRFARLAALLETADDEFAGLKKDLARYTDKVSAELKTNQPNVAIDGPSVSQLLKSDPLVVACEAEIAKRSNRPFIQADPRKYSQLADYLHSVGITTVSALHDFLRPNKKAIVRVALDRLSRGQGPVGAGITLLYTCYGVIARQRDADSFVRFLDVHGFGGEQSNRDFANDLIAAFDAAGSRNHLSLT